MMNNDDYTYKCRSEQDILDELFKTEFIEMSKLPIKSFDPDTGREVNKREIAVRKLYEEKTKEIETAINDDRNRVEQNMLSIPLNHTVRINATTLVQRVSRGWIYIYETYSNLGAASSVIHKTTSFVASPEIPTDEIRIKLEKKNTKRNMDTMLEK